jgi:hypothetical protein
MRQGLAVFSLALAALFLGPTAAAQADTVTQLPFTAAPVWVAVDPAGQHVFVSGGRGTSSIVVLDFDGNVVATITGEEGASQMAVDTATHTLYAALDDASAISEINTQTLTETKRFSTAPFADPSSLVIAGGKLWFSCVENGAGCVVSANLDGSGMTSVNLDGDADGSASTALSVGGSNHNLLALGIRFETPTTVAVYDVSQNPPALVSSSDGGGCPDGGGNLQDMTLDPSGANLLVACGDPYEVASLATTNLLLNGAYPSGFGTQAVAMSADGNYVAAGLNNGNGDDLFVFPVGNTTPLRTWTLAAGFVAPHSLAFSPDDSHLFAVTNSESGQLVFNVLDQPTVPMVETHTSLSADPQSIYVGQQVTLTVHVTGTSTGTVHLYGTPNGGSKTLLSTGTLMGGQATFTLSPAVTTTYSAVLDAGPGYASSTSPDLIVPVMPLASTTVSLAPSQQHTLAGDQATLTAQVTGTPSGTVDLYGTPNGGGKTLVTTGTVSEGQVSLLVSPTATTTYSAVLEAGTGYTSSTSQDVMVIVVPRSMPIAVSQHRVTYGGMVKLKLTGLTSGTVDLFATPHGEPQILVQKATVTAGQGSATFTVPPKRTTTYFAEREDQSAASNDITVSVHPRLVFAVAVKRANPQIVRRRGEAVVIGAGRKPALPGEPLEIEIDRARSHGGWTTIARGDVPVGASGIVVLVGTIKKTGQYRTRASYGGDGNYTSVKSPWRGFRVG